MRVLLGPLGHILLQVALLHDFDTSVQRRSGRSVDLLLFDFDLLVKTFNSLCHVRSLLLHLHNHVVLHGDFLVGLPELPQIEGVSLRHLPPANNHTLDLCIQDHVLSLLDILPLVEILGHLSVDHAFDGIEATLAARPHSHLRLHLNLFVERFDSRLAITFQSLFHQDEFLLFFALA